MHQQNHLGWHKTITMVCMTLISLVAQAGEPAGAVSFVIGDATSMAVDGHAVAVTRGSEIEVGQTLTTGENGHIHMRMVDGAFLSVRPQSRLRIEQYHFDPAVPANNRIKYVLEQGVARSITGRAGEAAKENYRLNTPLAAIGIRGTDFVVQAGRDITRVSVQSGAVVMAPLGGDCLASGLGPCKSATSRVLTAAMRDAYLELRSRTDAPLLVPAEKALESPNHVAPPRPEEPRNTDKQNKGSVSGDSQDAVREAATGLVKNQLDAASAPPPVPVVSIAPVVAPVAVPKPPAAPQFSWGRWSNFVQPGQEDKSVVARLTPDREIAFGNDVFGLVRQTGTVVVPGSGIARFQLADSEAYVMRDHKTLTPAQVKGASLMVDFGAKRFDTALTVNSTEMAPVAVQASGRVTFQGQFFSDPNTTGTVVNGSLSPDLTQAGSVFQRDLTNSLGVVGVVRWIR
jgi:hypothetical protein